jgi:hypothetical protein
MPYWGWILLIAGLSALAVVALFSIVRTTHRMRAREPLHGDARDFAAPLPLDVAAGADGMTERELEAELRERSDASVSRDR